MNTPNDKMCREVLVINIMEANPHLKEPRPEICQGGGALRPLFAGVAGNPLVSVAVRTTGGLVLGGFSGIGSKFEKNAGAVR